MSLEEDGLLDLEDDLLDAENDLLQELDLGTAQAATPAARTGALSQPDSGTTTIKRKGRQPGSRPHRERPPLRARCKLCKLVVRRAREMRRFICKDKIMTARTDRLFVCSSLALGQPSVPLGPSACFLPFLLSFLHV
jgi:hypothetical protein